MTRKHLWAAFSGDGIMVHNVWAWNPHTAEVHVSDRHANKEAFSGEHVRKVSVRVYNAMRKVVKFPPII